MPAAPTSAGPEAVDLAASAGLLLDPWQSDVLDDALGETADGKWASAEVGLVVPRQNGKGSILEAKALHSLYLTPSRLVLWSAHEFKTAREGFIRFRALVDNYDHLRKKVRSVRTGAGDEGVELLDGSRLRFVARSNGSGRGFTGDDVLLDEAFALSDGMISALMPTLSAVPNPQIWYTSSGPLLTSTVLRRLCKRGRAGGSKSLTYLEWCADQTAESNDPRAWADANPGLGTRLSEQFTLTELDAMDDEDFRLERLGIWLEDAFDSLFDLAAWRSKPLLDRKSTMTDPVALAFDVTPDRSSGTIGAAGRRSDGLPHVEVIDSRSGTGWMVDRLVSLNAKHKPCAVVVDARSPAASLLPALAEAGMRVTLDDPRRGTGDVIVTTGVPEMAQACGAIYDAITDTHTLRHIGQPELDAAVEGAAQRPLGDSWAFSRKESRNNISPLVAVTLALHGLSVHGPVEESPEPWFAYA